MKLTERSKRILAARRDSRDRVRDGWEYVGEGGGDLWQLNRGGRYNHTITDVCIAADGKGLWIKTAARSALQEKGR